MLEKLRKKLLPFNAKLVAVSKTRPNRAMLDLYDQGQRIFGENRVEELFVKHAALPNDIEWHMIGHLQSKKVKRIAHFVDLIHAVDSLKLLIEINKRAQANDRAIRVLLQFHIASEESKYGFSKEEVDELLKSEDYLKMQNVIICGVMGMATLTPDRDQVRKEFKLLKSIFDELKENQFSTLDDFKEISMGMSGDYEIALEEGSTMVRIGSLLFNKGNNG